MRASWHIHTHLMLVSSWLLQAARQRKKQQPHVQSQKQGLPRSRDVQVPLLLPRDGHRSGRRGERQAIVPTRRQVQLLPRTRRRGHRPQRQEMEPHGSERSEDGVCDPGKGLAPQGGGGDVGRWGEENGEEGVLGQGPQKRPSE